jgi:hypothetical protein
LGKLVAELLFAMVNSLVREWENTLLLKMGTWLDARVHGRMTRIVVGISLGIGAYFVFPLVLFR